MVLRRRRRTTVLLLAAALGYALGCHAAGTRFLSLIRVQEAPVAIALGMDAHPEDIAEALNPFPRYMALQQALQRDLDRPTTLEPCFPPQLAAGLASGWYQLAIVTPAQYARMPQPNRFRVLVVPVDLRNRPTDHALLVVDTNSNIRAVSDLPGCVVAFGPADDSLTHHAALQHLREQGVQKSDLALELLPLPNSLKHFSTMRNVALSVMHDSSDAGFLTASAWEGFPRHDPQEGPAQDQLRVIDRTRALPHALVLVSPALDETTVSRVRQFFLDAGEQHPAALAPIGFAGYVEPDDELLESCRGLVLADHASPKAAPPTPAPATQESP